MNFLEMALFLEQSVYIGQRNKFFVDALTKLNLTTVCRFFLLDKESESRIPDYYLQLATNDTGYCTIGDPVILEVRENSL